MYFSSHNNTILLYIKITKSKEQMSEYTNKYYQMICLILKGYENNASLTAVFFTNMNIESTVHRSMIMLQGINCNPMFHSSKFSMHCYGLFLQFSFNSEISSETQKGSLKDVLNV